ncbi:hypothetical protein [Salinarimonas ramus]|uniref:Uncharacterized protein n=1 Tax=Salinarimonas ramus TaxID=690164 RepID=A0A917Q8B9_9HYPH|nr:hypothetical protein [Salinarimonas ramus]GGK35824.1 hypothetical protein GCM10011322_23480 [Salinarimonas ramus]
MKAIFLAAGLAGLGAGAASAHSWYDAWCCDDRDCAPYPAALVSITDTGYRLDDGTVVPFDEARTSKDGAYHRCVLHGRQRCFYAPPMSF